MPYRALCVDQDPLKYFLQDNDAEPSIRVADIVLRENKSPKEVFAHMIRIATGSKWSHSAIFYLISNPRKGFDNTFLVEALTKGVHLASWRNEVIPFEQFTVGIKRPRLDWYVETPYEASLHEPCNPRDVPGVAYLHHVRGIAMDQLNGLYDHKTVFELTALYAERVARRHLGMIPQVAEAADAVAGFFKKWDEKSSSAESMLRFICSGLVQYSFFEALRVRIKNNIDIPENREAALSNLSNMQRVIFREDPDGVIPNYIRQVQAGELDIHDAAPDDVLDLLKTATPADFNNSPNLEWRYVILKGVVWQIAEAPEGYQPQSEDEASVLELLGPEHPAVDKEWNKA
ncbi:MAG TPA: hypothetical protein VFU49_06620 [Ktedonobacteraceae bacterium]|nr:hypothetical protein [Ktedonobacteraceae bacterium]